MNFLYLVSERANYLEISLSLNHPMRISWNIFLHII